MKRTFEFDDIAAVDMALKNLRLYNRAMYISVDEKSIDNRLTEEYFRAVESEKEAELEKVIGAAAIQDCNDNPDIPQKYKQKVGNRMQRELLAAVRAAKVDYRYQCGEFGMPGSPIAEKEREKRHKEIAIVGKAHYLKKATKSIRRVSSRIAQKEVICRILKELTDNTVVVKWGTRAIMLAVGLIPDRVKTKVKERAKEVFEKTANIIERGGEKFKETPVGSKVMELLETKVAPVINQGIDTVQRVISQGKIVFRRLKTRIKSRLA